MKPINLFLILITVSLSTLIAEETTDSTGAVCPTKESFGYFTAGWTMADLNNLNSSTKPHGVESLGSSALTIGLGHETAYNRFIVNGLFMANFWMPGNNDVARTNLTELEYGLNFGFDLIKNKNVRLYPYAGARIGWLMYLSGSTDLPYDSLYTGTAQEDFRLDQLTVKLEPGLGFNVAKMGKYRQHFLGIQAGYAFDVSSTDSWYRRFSSIEGGPEVSTSGPYARLILGLGKTALPEEPDSAK